MARPRTKKICVRCGTQQLDGMATQRGSELLGCLLWLLIFPGILYQLWRNSTLKRVCVSCGSEDLVPLSSPTGKKLLGDQPVMSDDPVGDARRVLDKMRDESNRQLGKELAEALVDAEKDRESDADAPKVSETPDLEAIKKGLDMLGFGEREK